MGDAKTILSEAMRALDAEKPQRAKALLAPLLLAMPNHAESQFLIAKAHGALGDTKAAWAAFEAALAAAPKESAIWIEMALFAWGLGEGPAVLRRAKGAGLPDAVLAMVAEAAQGTGSRAHGAGDAPAKAIKTLIRAATAGDARAAGRAEAALRGKPGPEAWLWIGRARLLRRAFGNAEAAFRSGLRLSPHAVDLRLGLARALARQDKTLIALAEARRVSLAAPAWPEAQVVYGRLALAAGLADRALDAAEAALKHLRKDDAARSLAAEAALASNRPAEAVDHARALSPKAPKRRQLLARSLTAAKQSEAALAAWTALGTDPESRTAKAQLLQSLGRAEEAEAELRAILAADPTQGLAARALAYGTKLAPDDPAIPAMDRAIPNASPDNQRLLRYALARALERIDPNQAAAHLAKANAATAARWPHDPEIDRAELNQVTGPDWDALKDAAPSDSAAAPIFVTGLPRSGTTLVETILAAHSQVAQGGELGVLRHALRPLRQDLAEGVTPDSAGLAQAADTYVQTAHQAAGTPDAQLRLTDKSIHSFVQLGAITKVLPRARVVIVHRDPRDTGLSIWRNAFADGQHRYAATWGGIADHITLFRDAVAFWRDALPKGCFYEIAYEDLLADPEGQTRHLIEACGLPWEDACLSFHETAGRVDTLSFAQVRRPIYTSSKGGWQQAGDQVAPLIQALRDRGLID